MKTREEANSYYKLVNDIIDKYLDVWNISPFRLKKYLSIGSKNYDIFLDRNELSGISNIDIVIKDILEDRIHEYNELKKEESMDIHKYEKALADFYNSSIGHIESKGDNKFLIKEFNSDIDVLIYTKDDLLNIRNSIIENAVKMDDVKIVHTFKIYDIIQDEISLLDSINKNALVDKLKTKFTLKEVVKIISTKESYKFMKYYKDTWYIFEKKK